MSPDPLNTRTPPIMSTDDQRRAQVIKGAQSGVIRAEITGITEEIVIAVPPGAALGWKAVRIKNFCMFPFSIVGIPDGSAGDPPQIIAAFQEQVYPFSSSKGKLVLTVPPDVVSIAPFDVGFLNDYGHGIPIYVAVEFTDTPDLFQGSYPVPLTTFYVGTTTRT